MTASAPFVSAQGLLSVGPNVRGAMVRGVLPEAENTVVDVGHKMLVGQLSDCSRAALALCWASSWRGSWAGRGDKVTLITLQGQITPAGMMPRLKQFTVVGCSRWICLNTTPRWR